MKIKRRSRSRGNTKEQNKRRRKRLSRLPEHQTERFELIDGNFTHRPMGYCRTKKAWVSLGIYECHGCSKCVHYLEGVELYE